MSESGIYPIGSGAAVAAEPNPAPLGASGGKSGPVAGNNAPPTASPASTADIDRLVEELNIRALSIGRTIRFQVDPNTSTPIIQVFDRDTGKLIRQIPADQAKVLASSQRTLDLERVIDVV